MNIQPLKSAVGMNASLSSERLVLTKTATRRLALICLVVLLVVRSLRRFVGLLLSNELGKMWQNSTVA
jgi:hypothetical protein